jgi:hypothetical protein
MRARAIAITHDLRFDGAADDAPGRRERSLDRCLERPLLTIP